ncbi:sugar ABC transporter ATP-binding protein [Aurantimonas sp. HBX-1]|uniref:sugar ABC transporter ATP-binding protein n=1 Tax=Aurantimonas sp. HBX-1 TaxID=2906072 RepID=UPI001F2D4517|nr:sugar ABC transporter ATP-binding protein [Aurantimonas sp. HBX-1]UIJ72633.1 sugar ABC transporter ATP-binding protein [Aurantimonas sp. HBX-1]
MKPQPAIVDDDASAANFSLRGISKNYGAIRVIEGIDLDIRAGECLAVLGENGAGKSTLSSIIAGIVPPTSGSMSWRGEPFAPHSPADALSQGIGLIHQEMQLLPHLSIAENVFVGRLLMRNGRLDRTEMNRRAEIQLRRLGLDVPATTLVGSLKVAAQQQVEIAKALTLEARLLIFDEPTAALGGDETDRLFAQIERLKQEGVASVYISHRLEEIGRIADRIAVLRDGNLVALHETARVPVRQLVEEMVGRSVERLFPDLGTPQPRDVLTIANFSSAEGAFEDISLSVRAGEIFGIAGIIGAGRTELVRAIAGADRLKGGTMTLDGRVARPGSPREALDMGIVLVPEDRKGQALLLQKSIEENVAVGNFDLIGKSGWVRPARTRALAEKAIAAMGVKGRPDQLAMRLSGGNQQKVVIAKWLARNPKLFIMDEPTRGVDVGARAQIYEAIVSLAKSGMAVILVSSDLDEVIGLSHRVLVLSRGRNRGILDREHATHVAIMERATH